MNRAQKRIAVLALCCIAAGATVRDAMAVEAAATERRPNAVGEISVDFLDYMLRHSIDRQSSIAENVLGTSVRGAAQTRGDVAPILIQNGEKALVQLRVSGTVQAPNMIGRNGPATIRSSAHTQFEVRKNVLLSAAGIEVMPAVADCNTHVRIQDVSAQRRFVERVARRRVDRSQGQAQAVTSARTEARLQKEVDQDAADPLAQANEYFVNYLIDPLKAKDAFPKLFEFSSNDQHIRVLVKQCCLSKFAPPDYLPKLSADHDIAVALHSSAVKSVYETFYSGRTSMDREMLKTVHMLTGEDPRPLRVHDRTPRWSMTWADRVPLDLVLDDNHVTFTVNLKALTHGQQTYEGRFSVSAGYQVEKTASGPLMLREGDLKLDGEVASDSPGELGAVLSILENKFSAIFPEQIAFHGLTPPTGGIWDKIRAMQLVQLETRDGWFVIGYQIPRPAAMLASHGRDSKQTYRNSCR